MVVAQPCLHCGPDNNLIILLWGSLKPWMDEGEGRRGGAGVAEELVELWSGSRDTADRAAPASVPALRKLKSQCRAAFAPCWVSIFP